jgi:hypothetical protein
MPCACFFGGGTPALDVEPAVERPDAEGRHAEQRECGPAVRNVRTLGNSAGPAWAVDQRFRATFPGRMFKRMLPKAFEPRPAYREDQQSTAARNCSTGVIRCLVSGIAGGAFSRRPKVGNAAHYRRATPVSERRDANSICRERRGRSVTGSRVPLNGRAAPSELFTILRCPQNDNFCFSLTIRP